MVQIPVLENELDRLSDLYSLNLLDTNKEERFDRLTRLAQRAMNVEICYLALVDENRQWLKSKCGVSIDETHRNVSFCAHTIAEDAIMIVPDALQDERFRDNPLVTNDPYIRFYAGYPLKGPNGMNIGTFCIADGEPRNLNAEQQELLIEYASLVQRELNLLDVIESQGKLLETQIELEKVQRNLHRELGEAADFVHQKLPPRFEDEKFKLDWAFLASSQLGGDMFGMDRLSDDRYLIYLLDVAGHGIGASLMASAVQNTMQQILTELQTKADSSSGTEPTISPAAVLQNLNSHFQMESNQDKFFTIWCGVVDLAEQQIQFANAGHPAPILFDSTHQATALSQDSLMIGVVPHAVYTDMQIEYAADSRLILFSDGILEEMNDDDQQFGRQRLETAYRNRCEIGNCDLSAILKQVQTWNGNKPFADDVSLVELTMK